MITREQFRRVAKDPWTYTLVGLFCFCSALLPGHTDWSAVVDPMLFALGGFNLGTAVSKI